MPRKGWEYVGIEDHLSPVFTCEMCGNDAVRFEHVLRHAEVDHAVGVGCVCAGHMLEDYERPRRRENDLKARLRAVEAFTSREWRRGRRGGFWKEFRGKGFVVLAWKAGDGYAGKVVDRTRGVEKKVRPRASLDELGRASAKYVLGVS
jgi:hypothetical protein